MTSLNSKPPAASDTAGLPRPVANTPRYPVPMGLLLRMGFSMLLNRRRLFSMDARSMVQHLRPPLQVLGEQNIPRGRACVLTANHYSRPGFGAWWIALALSAVLPDEIHWVMTNAWTFPGKWYAGLLRPISRLLFLRLAHTYRFSSMPAMPPEPGDAGERGASIRQVMAYIRNTPQAVIGLVPEGRDFASGKLGWPPSGSGRFMLHLARQGLEFAPVGVYEENGALCLNFGEPYRVQEIHSHASGEVHPNTLRLVAQHQVDLLIRRGVMRRIAIQLPAHLRGEFGD